MSLSGDGLTLAVGARLEGSRAKGIDGDQRNQEASYSGAVYLFANVDGGWQQQAYIKSSNTDAFDFFGRSVSLSQNGDYLAVGATGEDSNGITDAMNVDPELNNSLAGSGAVYVFKRSAGTWQQQAYLKAADPVSGDRFGHRVAINAAGNTLAVSAILHAASSQAQRHGAVSVFTRSQASWAEQQVLFPSHVRGFSQRVWQRSYFGNSLGLSDDGSTLAVGASHECVMWAYPACTMRAGAAYVFQRESGQLATNPTLAKSQRRDF